MKKNCMAASAFLCCLVAAVLGSGCGFRKAEIKSTITEEIKFNSVVVDITPEEFFKAGFSFGDSCDVVFENGVELKDIPLYNGYYVKTGKPLIVVYPGFGNVQITYDNLGIWDMDGFNEGDSVVIRMNKKKKYFAVQEALGQQYSVDRKDYDSDEEFCNFRPLTGGKLKKDCFFRGASPVDNSRGRAAFTDKLLKQSGICQVVDLADSEDNIKNYRSSKDFDSDYAVSLYDAGKIYLLNMGSDYVSLDYQTKLISGLEKMLEGQTPVYIHCMEGKDRTGFVCMLFEALAGATYDEMAADYMVTYKNYYGVDLETAPEKYNSIKELYFDTFLEFILETEDAEVIKNGDYVKAAEEYLKKGGMSDGDIKRLKSFLVE